MLANKLRAAIVGMDHWYVALGELEATRRSEQVDIVALGHRDAAKAEETAARFGVPDWTTDFPGLVRRSDVDVIVTACTTAENPAICRAAAENGKHIVSVKPIAMNLEDAQSIAQAVRAADVQFMSWESAYRLMPLYRKLKQWIDEGRIGSMISAFTLLRSRLPTTPWPGEDGPTWWLDATKAPGGGWLDHAIYHIDFLRWLLNDEVARVSGEIANLKYSDLPFEDYGAANLAFAGGSRAACEVTWTGPSSGSISQIHLVGRDGEIVSDPSLSGKLALAGNFAAEGGPSGWLLTNPPGGSVSVLEHLAESILNGTPTVASVDDAVTNLRACLAFYDAARQGRAVTLSDGSCA